MINSEVIMKVSLSIVPGFPSVGKSILPKPYEWTKNVSLARTQQDRATQLIDEHFAGKIDARTLANKIGKMMKKRGISITD